MLTRRSRASLLTTLAVTVALCGPAAAPADLVEGPWEADTGGWVEIVPTAPGSYAATVVRSGTSRCPGAVGSLIYTLTGAFPDYSGTASYSNASTCAHTGFGLAVFRVDRNGLLLCSRPPGVGMPTIGDAASDCRRLRRPGAARTTECGALWLRGGRLVRISNRRALEAPRRFRPTAALVRLRGGGCSVAERVLVRVLGASDERLALQRAGLPFVRTTPLRRNGRSAYTVVAGDGGTQLTYLRHGGIPEPDHRTYRAGQQLHFADSNISRGAGCTGGFAVLLADGRRGLLSAGHCAARDDGSLESSVFRRIDARPYDRLGTPTDASWPADPDVSVSRLEPRWASAPQIERGELPPLTVTRAATVEQMSRGRPVCFAGRVSGADQCGRITLPYGGTLCTDVAARRGDSGGPVYSPPRSGFTDAMGIVSIARRDRRRSMCFVPIGAALSHFGATLMTGP